MALFSVNCCTTFPFILIFSADSVRFNTFITTCPVNLYDLPAVYHSSSHILFIQDQLHISVHMTSIRQAASLSSKCKIRICVKRFIIPDSVKICVISCRGYHGGIISAEYRLRIEAIKSPLLAFCRHSRAKS